MSEFVRFFKTLAEAKAYCDLRILTGEQFKVIDGPEDNYAVVDSETAKDILSEDGEDL